MLALIHDFDSCTFAERHLKETVHSCLIFNNALGGDHIQRHGDIMTRYTMPDSEKVTNG
ncbi:hypothetical protein D3C80_1625100 [compost metagenome]